MLLPMPKLTRNMTPLIVYNDALSTSIALRDIYGIEDVRRPALCIRLRSHRRRTTIEAVNRTLIDMDCDQYMMVRCDVTFVHSASFGKDNRAMIRQPRTEEDEHVGNYDCSETAV